MLTIITRQLTRRIQEAEKGECLVMMEPRSKRHCFTLGFEEKIRTNISLQLKMSEDA